MNQPGVASLNPAMPGPRLSSLLGPCGYNPCFSSPQTGEDSRPGVRQCSRTHQDIELLVPGRPSHTHPITDISVWVETFAVMAAILATCFPEKVSRVLRLHGYYTIVRAERNYEGERWVVNDCQFRREALARSTIKPQNLIS